MVPPPVRRGRARWMRRSGPLTEDPLLIIALASGGRGGWMGGLLTATGRRLALGEPLRMQVLNSGESFVGSFINPASEPCCPAPNRGRRKSKPKSRGSCLPK